MSNRTVESTKTVRESARSPLAAGITTPRSMGFGSRCCIEQTLKAAPPAARNQRALTANPELDSRPAWLTRATADCAHSSNCSQEARALSQLSRDENGPDGERRRWRFVSHRDEPRACPRADVCTWQPRSNPSETTRLRRSQSLVSALFPRDCSVLTGWDTVRASARVADMVSYFTRSKRPRRMRPRTRSSNRVANGEVSSAPAKAHGRT